MGWSSYPPEHKRSFKRALLCYAVTVALAAGWIWYRADSATALWQQRVPHASADIRTVYVTKITEDATSFSNDNTIPAPGGGEGYISIIMTNAGISEHATARAIEDLPPAVALAFSPYAPKLDDWIHKADDAHRESLILLPMEPSTYPKDDPGPQALLARLGEKDNNVRLDWALDKAGDSIGAMNFMGSGFLTDDRNTRPVFDELRKRGVLFIEKPTPAGVGVSANTAQAAGLPYLAADMNIDANATELAIKQKLLDLETLAHKRGYAVGIAQPYPVTFDILKDWAESLDRRGIKLVPVKAVLKAKVQHDKAASPEQQQGQLQGQQAPASPPNQSQQPQQE